jgi:single-stranded DNA-binding protein
MAKIVRNPQLRYTQDGQLPVAEMMVQFDNLSPNSPPSTLKVVSWGSVATEIQEKYKEGDEVILSGRLKMNVIEKPEGFKEKKAELTASSIFFLNSSPDQGTSASPSSGDVEIDLEQIPDDDFSSPPDSPENEEDTIDQNLDNIPF